MFLSSGFDKFVTSVKGFHRFKIMKRESVALGRPSFCNMWQTWPKTLEYLQLSQLLWYFNLVLSLSCCWLRAFSLANKGVLVWLGEKVFDTLELLLVWDCPFSIEIASLGCPLFLFLSPSLTCLSLSCLNFLRIRWLLHLRDKVLSVLLLS